MKTAHRAAALFAAVAITGAAQPLVLKEQGSFFVGGETRSLNSTPGGGEITPPQVRRSRLCTLRPCGLAGVAGGDPVDRGECIWVTHGYRTPLVRWLTEQGMAAQAAETRWEDEA